MGLRFDETTGSTFVEHEHPVRYREGSRNVTRTCAWSAPGCHLGCGLLVSTDDEGNVVKVEGDPDNPFNDGRLCVRCLDVKEVLYHEDRLKYPMRRAGKRGENKWERITWDEAYDEITEKLFDIRDKYGAESVVFCKGTSRDASSWISRLCWSFGSPNVIMPMSGTACFVPKVSSMIANTGAVWIGDYSQQFADRYDNPNWKVPPVIMCWGENPIVSNSAGLFGHWVVDCMKRGSKLIVVDPRRTWLANRADLYCPVRPGTDGAFVLGMLRTIIDEDLWDHEFVDKWCFGFDELCESVQKWDLDTCEAITGCPKERIQEAARMYANLGGICQWGVSIDQCSESVPTQQGLMALISITGNIEKPGTNIVGPTVLAYFAGWGEDDLPEEQRAKKIGAEKYPLVKFGFRNASTDEVLKTIETADPYPIHAAWIQTTNILACTGCDPDRTKKAYESLDFIVGVDVFMNPTLMALADIVLPACTFMERDGLRLADGAQRGEVISKVIEPLWDTKPDMQINLELGHRWNPEMWPWATVKEMYSEMISSLGMDFDQLESVAPMYVDFQYNKHEKGLLRRDGQPGFNTTTGLIELNSIMFSSFGLNPVADYEEPVPSILSTPELAEEYPLTMTSGSRVWSMFHSEHRQVPRLRAMHPYPRVQIHPNDAEKYGVKQGDWVWIENEHGRAKRRVTVTPIITEGVINADHGWWLPEATPDVDGGLFGTDEVNLNRLLPYNPGKSGFGCNYKTTLVKIYKTDAPKEALYV